MRLSAGITHYSLSGSAQGRPVVFVHGIAGPMGSFDPVADILAEEGYQALQYDLYGRGYSDRPFVKYTLDLFVLQLRELLSELRINGPITLIGWSLGGMISASFAAQYPDSTERIVYIAPAGIDVSLPLVGRLAMAPAIGELIMAVAGRRAVLRSIANGLIDEKRRRAFIELASEQMESAGYLRSFLSTLRNCAYLDVSDRYAKSGTNIPVMMIIGSEDPSIPSRVQDEISRLIPHIQVKTFDGVGHFPHFERPADVGSLVSQFLADERVHSG